MVAVKLRRGSMFHCSECVGWRGGPEVRQAFCVIGLILPAELFFLVRCAPCFALAGCSVFAPLGVLIVGERAGGVLEDAAKGLGAVVRLLGCGAAEVDEVAGLVQAVPRTQATSLGARLGAGGRVGRAVKTLVKVLQEGARVGGQRFLSGGAGGGGVLSPALAPWCAGAACGAPGVAGSVFGFGFRSWHVGHHPVRVALAVLCGLVADFLEVPGGQVRFMDFVHLLFDVVVVRVALLRGKGTVLGVQERGMGVAVLEGGEDFIAENFIAALGHRREGFEVVVVQWPVGALLRTSQYGSLRMR